MRDKERKKERKKAGKEKASFDTVPPVQRVTTNNTPRVEQLGSAINHNEGNLLTWIV